LDVLPYNEPQQDELGHLRSRFDSNPWRDFFSFTNSLFRDFYFETADNAQDWREFGVQEEPLNYTEEQLVEWRAKNEVIMLNQPLAIRRILE
jgi:hypothetical protein